MSSPHVQGEFRVFGPPGCGKTTALEHEITRALEDYDAEDIFITSFSKTAAEEIAQRGLNQEGDIQLGTLHSMAYRSIGSLAIVPNSMTLRKEWDEEYPDMAFGEQKSRWDADDPYNDDTSDDTGYLLLNQLNINRSLMLPQHQWDRMTLKFADRWESFKRSNGCIDFTDMIEVALKDTATAPGDPRVGLIDEAQDLTPLELALVRKWGKQTDYFILCGDDDQAIFSFRGSTPEAFLNPPTTNKRVLEQSYRVPQAVHSLSMNWIRQIRKREPKTYHPTDVKGEIRMLDATWRYVDAVLEDIQQQTAEGRTCMVLATCSFMLEPIITAFREAGLIFHNKYRKSAYHWNPLAQGKDDNLSAADRVKAYSAARDGRLWTASEFRAWLEVVKIDGIAKRGMKKKLANIGGNMPMTVEAIFEYLNPDFLLRLEETGYPYSELTDRLLAGYRTVAYAAKVADKHGLATLDKEPLITVGTIHSVKGGEASVVYIFPDTTARIEAESAESQSAADAVVRLFYVALTRAKETVCICEPLRPRYAVALEDYLN